MSNRKIVDKTAHANPGTPNSNRHIETLGELNEHLDRDDWTGRLDGELSPGSLRLVQRERRLFLSTENAWRREEKRLERELKRATDGAARLLYQSKKTHYLRRAAVDVLQERELAGEAKNFRLPYGKMNEIIKRQQRLMEMILDKDLEKYGESPADIVNRDAINYQVSLIPWQCEEELRLRIQEQKAKLQSDFNDLVSIGKDGLTPVSLPAPSVGFNSPESDGKM